MLKVLEKLSAFFQPSHYSSLLLYLMYPRFPGWTWRNLTSSCIPIILSLLPSSHSSISNPWGIIGIYYLIQDGVSCSKTSLCWCSPRPSAYSLSLQLSNTFQFFISSDIFFFDLITCSCFLQFRKHKSKQASISKRGCHFCAILFLLAILSGAEHYSVHTYPLSVTSHSSLNLLYMDSVLNWS